MIYEYCKRQFLVPDCSGSLVFLIQVRDLSLGAYYQLSLIYENIAETHCLVQQTAGVVAQIQYYSFQFRLHTLQAVICIAHLVGASLGKLG